MIKLDTLKSEPITVNDLAAKVKVDARYLREWCEGLHLSGYIDCDKLTDPVKARNCNFLVVFSVKNRFKFLLKFSINEQMKNALIEMKPMLSIIPSLTCDEARVSG